jgi:competence protein ComEA
VVPGRGAAAASASGAQSGPISLGSATVEQLDQIEGIGPVTAQKIIEFRDQHGGLSSIEQLDEVDGIGPSTMQTLRSSLQP